MTNDNSTYAFEPATFHSMRQAQELTDVLEENLITLRLCNPIKIDLLSRYNVGGYSVPCSGVAARVNRMGVVRPSYEN